MPENYFAGYLPLLLHLTVAFGLASAIVILSQLLGRHRYTKAKFTPYESGMLPQGDARGRFSVKFYLVAMVFILFDVEAVFLYPWAILFQDWARDVNAVALKRFWIGEMLVYIAIILAGFWYIVKKGVLDWTEQRSSEVTTRPDDFYRAIDASRPGTAELIEVRASEVAERSRG